LSEEAKLETTEETTTRALDAALNYLSYRQRTGHEVRRKLIERGFDDETVEAALRRLENVGLVDDESFVAAYVRDRIAHRPMGVRRMAQELYVKGIRREQAIPLIEAALGHEGTNELELARRVAERKGASLRRRDDELALSRKRLRDHLLRRGFDSRVIQAALDEVLPQS
jgi:regulatory protein